MSKKIKIELTENMSIKDSLAVTSWLSPTMFKNQFEIFKDKYFLDGNNEDLVMAYILLQIYIENHFHYYLRFIIGDGFVSNLKTKDWDEKDYVDKKLMKLKDFLTKGEFDFNRNEFDTILKNYRNISEIRNKFLHGHPVTETIADNKISQSKAREFLNRQKFNEARSLANVIANLWNSFLYTLQTQEVLLKKAHLPSKSFLENCKFEIF